MDNAVKIFDTTLRDGTQGEGISLSVDDKIKIAQRLDALGVHYIEGGWPGSNNKDIEFFERAKSLKLNRAKITAFGSTRRKNIEAKDDANLNLLVESGVSVATIFGKSWDFHVHEAIRTSLEENLNMIGDSVVYLKSQGLEVIYDAEHFFDGYKNNPDYALQTIKRAESAGADWVILCDTNGGTLPGEISEIVQTVCSEIEVLVGIHAHNDCELGVANSLAAVQAGARQVHGTINGYGERCGNANLVSIIPNLQLKLDYTCVSDEQLQTLTSVSRYVSEMVNVHMPNNQPYVGSGAFAHKGGIHVSAILRHAKTYEHITPELVGNKQRVLVSELAGQSNLLFKAKELQIEIDKENPHTKNIIAAVKDMEHQGYQFEAADASLELLLLTQFGKLKEKFRPISFKILGQKTKDDAVISEAIVKLQINEDIAYTVAEGNGPVNALDKALRKALIPYYPAIETMHLSDYKVRVISEKDATAAKVRVLIESSNARSSWTTVGVSENVIEASWEALIDSIRYGLLKEPVTTNTQQEPDQAGIANH